MANNDAGHVDATAQQLAELYEQHYRSAGSVQRLANWITALISRPATLTVIICAVVLWMLGNLAARMVGSHALEQFPFPDLAFVATIAAFLIALLILTTQRHEDQLAEKRARLTLQIAVVSEKKIAKLIALVEEQRLDNPMLSSRVDAEASAMAAPADPRESLKQIEGAESSD